MRFPCLSHCSSILREHAQNSNVGVRVKCQVLIPAVESNCPQPHCRSSALCVAFFLSPSLYRSRHKLSPQSFNSRKHPPPSALSPPPQHSAKGSARSSPPPPPCLQPSEITLERSGRRTRPCANFDCCTSHLALATYKHEHIGNRRSITIAAELRWPPFGRNAAEVRSSTTKPTKLGEAYHQK